MRILAGAAESLLAVAYTHLKRMRRGEEEAR
jgi:hypothetical protein